MQFKSFTIRNFKGIIKASIKVADEAPGAIITLIGLNESGKTTILEAISNFGTEDKEVASLVRSVQASSEQDFIPKDKKAAFSGKISVEAVVELDSSDQRALRDIFKSEHSLNIDITKIPKEISVERMLHYEDSIFDRYVTNWGIVFHLKKKGEKKFQVYSGRESEKPDKKSIWLTGIKELRRRMPKIVYFPTFLFNFPERIYISDDVFSGEEKNINVHYKNVIQDVLDSQGGGISLKKHVLDRIDRLRASHSDITSFVVSLFGGDVKRQIDAVLQAASNEMSRVIFGSWNQILGRDIVDKRVQIDWQIDPERNNAPYLELSIIDGQSRYSLTERSLGFRWFFSFLLFTQFRRNRIDDGATIFLFDEPAANLHAKAQIKLLESFTGISGELTKIVYSTHSHYMINPLWLEKAYIVENKSTNYDKEYEMTSFSVQINDVVATKYKEFLGSHPNQTTYFQPVLDALDVAISPLLKEADAIIVEGKYDFHAISYLQQRWAGKRQSGVFPVNGAGNAGRLISLFRGWGVNFRVLLDADDAGVKEKNRYIDEYLLSDSQVALLSDVDPVFANSSFESVYGSDVSEAIKKEFKITSIKKKHYALFFQNLIAANADIKFSETETAYRPIAEWIDKSLRK